MDGELWGDARVTFPDWKGTAQLDERKTVPWQCRRSCNSPVLRG
jgi:hypothetical protein